MTDFVDSSKFMRILKSEESESERSMERRGRSSLYISDTSHDSGQTSLARSVRIKVENLR